MRLGPTADDTYPTPGAPAAARVFPYLGRASFGDFQEKRGCTPTPAGPNTGNTRAAGGGVGVV